MKYLIMECHKGYAIAMDESGRFLEVANMNYHAGQTVSQVLMYQEKKGNRKWMKTLTAVAACLCLLIVGSWQFFTVTYGTVTMRINPEVSIRVNRLCYVTQIEGNNADGEKLIEDYSYKGKKVKKVVNELTQLAMDMGYLTEGGTVNLGVQSNHTKWQKANLDGLANEIDQKFEHKIKVKMNPGNHASDNPETTEAVNETKRSSIPEEKSKNNKSIKDDDREDKEDDKDWEDKEEEDDDKDDKDDDREDDDDDSDEKEKVTEKKSKKAVTKKEEKDNDKDDIEQEDDDDEDSDSDDADSDEPEQDDEEDD